MKEFATLGEVEEKLNVAIEEAQGEHEDLWTAMQFVDWAEDDENSDSGEEG
jgi:hypothetical protein